MAANAVSPAEARRRLHARGKEIAFLDLREHGQYGEGHPFLAVPCPWSRLEAAVPSLVPRLGAPILLLDAGDGIAERASASLTALGYRDLAWIDGGAPAWAAAGFTLFKGVNVPSKTLGELLEEHWHVPRISVETLAAWQEERRDFRLFDGRPASEYRKTTVPGAISFPNGELPHRFAAAMPETGGVPVVVHCAGRTRSIVGAAGLALAGVPAEVYALENGTQGWALSGRTLQKDAMPAPLPALGAAGLEASAERGRRTMARYAISEIDAGELRRLAQDASRTLYLLDVRSAEEFAAGSVPSAVHAPAVQLAQASDQWLGVRRARVVLADDTGLRAAITAVFLSALNYEVFVLPGVDRMTGETLKRADAPSGDRLPSPPPRIAAREALELASAGGTLLDLRSSGAYRAAHLAGARWTIRPGLGALEIDPAQPVLLAGDAVAVGLAAVDLAERGLRIAGWVADDPEAWRKAGLPVVATPDAPADAEAIDYLFFVHDRHDGNMEAARQYLAWETGLVASLDAAELSEYRIGPSPFG